MFVCNECRRRAYTAVLKNRPRGARQFDLRRRVLPPISWRAYATAPIEQGRDARRSEASPEPVRPHEPSARLSSSPNLEWVVNKHLEYLKDPFKIAEHVKATLSKGQFEEAALLTRKASRDAKCTVSWNHLIDYQMKNQRLRGAIKLYNEMKKRAQVPDAHTYTILFRGCANSEHPKLAVSEAVKLYHSMMSDERIKPNTIHLNAVIEVCARAEDIESMFSIVKTANDTLRSPNNRTYTLILNALRRTNEKPQNPPLSDAEIQTNKQLAIRRSRAIWEEAVTRWRKGQINIDEELVCAMGRVLLMGGYEDSRDVLSLVQQTMKIPRLDLEAATQISECSSRPGGPARDSEETTTPRDNLRSLSVSAIPYAIPGNNTLSLILKSLENTRKTSLGGEYWDLFTKVYGLPPDADNYHELLRVLRTGRASAKAADVVAHMPAEFLAAKTFRIAMSACVRDNINDGAFQSAGKILDVMTASMKFPDAHTLRRYLHIATADRQKFKLQAENGDPEGAKFALGQQIVRGLDRMWKPFRQVSVSFSSPGFNTRSPEEQWARQYNEQREAVALARKIIAATDRVVTQGMAAPDIIRVLKTRRNILNRYVVRFFEKREEREPNLNPKRRARHKAEERKRGTS